MRKTVLVFGLIAGTIMSVLMAMTMPFHDRIGPETGRVLGYTSMVLAFMLVFFGIRSYRDRVRDGAISFGRACAVGALITVVASLCYVASWQVIYYNFMPDFAERWSEQTVERARAGGASAAELSEKRAEMERWAAMYHNPLFNAAFTLLEPLPVGLIMTLVSAGILRRRRRTPAIASYPEPLSAVPPR
jgi:hypothetical protein